MSKKLIIVSLIFLCSCAALAYADNATLEWEANDDADFYVIYWSMDPNTFTDDASIEVDGNVTTLELVSSPGNETYYYSIKAFNECGNSSEFSAPIESAYLPLAIYSGSSEKNTTPSIAKSGGGGGGCFIESVI